MNDKDIAQILSCWPKKANYYFTQANIPRALDKDLLKDKALAEGLIGECYDNVNMALKQAVQNAHAHDLLIVCGSVFVVGEVDQDYFSKRNFSNP